MNPLKRKLVFFLLCYIYSIIYCNSDFIISLKKRITASLLVIGSVENFLNHQFLIKRILYGLDELIIVSLQVKYCRTVSRKDMGIFNLFTCTFWSIREYRFQQTISSIYSISTSSSNIEKEIIVIPLDEQRSYPNFWTHQTSGK